MEGVELQAYNHRCQGQSRLGLQHNEPRYWHAGQPLDPYVTEDRAKQMERREMMSWNPSSRKRLLPVPLSQDLWSIINLIGTGNVGCAAALRVTTKM